VVVDDRKVLVTSANFTDRGQSRTVEVGVLLDDPSFAAELSTQWKGLIRSGWVKRFEG
jgi:phosphatidylserine/phosphatidylglycerophosphate/cardiolipin synthase-like enzyme